MKLVSVLTAAACWLVLDGHAAAQSWGQAQILSPSDGTAGAYFGWALDVDGDTAVVGAPAATTPEGARGAVYVFGRGPSGWVEEARLVAPEPTAERFGAAVAIAGDSIVVGAPWTSTPSVTRAGAAYVFTRTAGAWDTGARLPASDSLPSQLGSSVTIDGDYVAVGALTTDAVYVFVRGTSGWTQQVRLTRNPFELTHGFGRDVALSGTALLVGADLADGPSGTDSGAALIYRRSGSTWNEEAHVYGGGAGNHFGQSVAIDGDYAVIGEPDHAGGYTAVGAAALYRRSGATWSRFGSTTVTAHSGARFGASVDIDGSTVLVSEFFEAGGIHIYTITGSTSPHVAFVTASDATAGERLGSALAVSGGDVFGGLNLGARRQAYVFGLLDDDGAACTSASSCLSGNCIDGVCCGSACGGGSSSDCQACSIAAGGASDGSCTTLTAARAPTVTCRAATGACDVAEVCSSTTTSCPSDRLAPSTTACRARAGACDVEETCTGASAACPDDAFAAATTTCRASAGACDVEETCTGASAACPDDAFAAATLTCRAAVGVCDLAESCTGVSAACPADAVALAGVECRSGRCVDGVAETAAACTGTDGTCPGSSTVACDAYVCGPTGCRTSCTSDTDCSSRHACVASTCVAVGPDAGAVDASVGQDAGVGIDAGLPDADAGVDAGVAGDSGPASIDAGTTPVSGGCACGASGTGASTWVWSILAALVVGRRARARS